MDEQLVQIEESQKKSQELILRLSKALKKVNERNENLQRKLDQALKLQNDSHETICGILEKKMEEIEQKHQEFIESMGEIMSKTVEGFESSQNNLERKMTESEELLRNITTEVALLKFNLNEHQKNIVGKKDTVTFDLTGSTTVTSSEPSSSKIRDHENCVVEEEREKVEENRSESVDLPKKKENSAKIQPEKSKKAITESVLDKAVVGRFGWLRNKVEATDDGLVLVIDRDHLYQLDKFLYVMKTMPIAFFPEDLFEIECHACEENFIIDTLSEDMLTTSCPHCNEVTIIGAPQPKMKYLICICSHAQLVPTDKVPPPCKFCKRSIKSLQDADDLTRTPFLVVQTLERQVEKILNLSHLQWLKPHVTVIDDEKIKIKCCHLPTCQNESFMDLTSFANVSFVYTWKTVPGKFEVDCWKCKKIIRLNVINLDGNSVKCHNCNETIVLVTGRKEEKPYKMVRYTCGHYQNIQSEDEEIECFICKCKKAETVSNKKIRVPWMRGQTKEWTWPESIGK